MRIAQTSAKNVLVHLTVSDAIKDSLLRMDLVIAISIALIINTD